MDTINDINLRLFQTFLVVASEGSFRLAGEKLNRAHSAVSVQIRQLEEQLQVKLFERTTRSVKLTEEGTKLQESLRKAHYEILHGLREIREAADLKRGQLSLASSSHVASVHLPPVLTQFVSEFPEVAVTIRELTSTDLYAALRKHEVDFAIGPHGTDQAFDFSPILVEPLHAVVHPRFLDPTKKTVTWREIAHFPILLPAPQTAMRRIVDHVLHDNGLVETNRYQFIQAETIIAMAEAGLGIAVQPSTRLAKHPPQTARVMTLTEPHIRRAMSLIRLKNRELSPAARHLADTIVREVRRVTDYVEGEKFYTP
ncbi:LysR family transcriptional regulator [Agrobacterium tumefaciens]|uniref:LysR family transcriptional regulator n=1 Tax=Agrobacterium tumefaciens TaxID=358 RepID=UPI0021CF18D9|nr:LysR family transcriptional regulator [Agrobacterium tumefaciens]UXS05315.1 LysR family transcriptional regulator [Agrobacterium tumefaciens]